MKTGALNRRITLTAPGASTPTEIGGVTTAAGTSTVVWCKAKQLSANHALMYGLDLATASYQFTFRYETVKNVTNQYTLTYENRTFRIVRIEEVDEEKTEIRIIANERAT
jgi:head-tail adaptor